MGRLLTSAHILAVTDTRFNLETPEGADLPLEPAGVLVRVLAYLIDWLIRFVLIVILAYFFSALGVFGDGFILIIYFLLEWFYPVFFEVYQNGKTPGKKKMGLRVVHDDSTPVGFSSSLIRNLLRVVDFLPSFYVTGMITMVFCRHFQRLGDLAGGTLVVYDTQKTIDPDFNISGSPLPVPANFSTEEQRALLNFTERSTSLSLERQEELAEQLRGVLGKENLVETIKRMAKHLVNPV